MNSSQKNIISILYRSKRTVFRLKDIALLTEENNFQSLNKKVNNMVNKNELINPRKGIYALYDYRNEELASKIFSPSYLSIDYVLQKEGIIFQYDSTFTSISYLSRSIEINERSFSFRKIKNEILTNTQGIECFNNGISIACAERAFLDYVYLNGDSYFDNISILKKKKVMKLLPIYRSKTLSQRITKILEYA